MAMNIRFSGFGGQGIVLSGYIYGVAAVLDRKKALQTQSYGSESRGGGCRSDVIISDEDIYELAPPRVDVLVALSQAAYDAYLPALKPDGTLIVEDDLVDQEPAIGAALAPLARPGVRDAVGGDPGAPDPHDRPGQRPAERILDPALDLRHPLDLELDDRRVTIRGIRRHRLHRDLREAFRRLGLKAQVFAE